MGTLHDLYDQQGQSPWLDNLKRAWLESGEIQRWIDRGVRGITSNPSIFQKAIESSEEYTAQLADLVGSGASIEDAYWAMVVSDIEDALALLRPVYDRSDGVDGYVSVEVSPALARDTAGTEAQARQLWDRISRPNLYVKIPATLEGLPAIRSMIGEGRNINVTLIFSLERYAAVMEAYVSGLEDAVAAGREDLSSISSVASFFISRVDTEVDRRLLGRQPGARASSDLRSPRADRLHMFRTVFGPPGTRWRPGAPGSASAVGLDLDQPRLPRHPVVDTLIGRQREHAARCDPGGVRGPWHRRQDRRRGHARCEAPVAPVG
jgi:transaldolase